MSSTTNIQIAIRVRPLNKREIEENLEPLWQVHQNSIKQIDLPQVCYSFDHIFNSEVTNNCVYEAVVQPLVKSSLTGINSTIFAYGQTSSGKTHTIHGDAENPGIISYAIEDIFKYTKENTDRNFLLRCSYLEIYNEKIIDLLDEQAKDIKIRENAYRGVFVAVKEEVIKEKNELYSLMKRGMKIRKIGCTDLNERSSRSHTIFKMIIQSRKKDSDCSYTESSLSLVDLAGSERVGQMDLKGERQTEGVLINKSLTTLGRVIRKLSENEQFINYRDSKLTRLLQDSLGGNSKTLIICTITPAANETKSTLDFAQRAKYVKNLPKINEKTTDKDQLRQYTKLCEDYKKAIEQLNSEKNEKEKTINALQDKILNIELFSSYPSNINKTNITPSKRRHTLANYNNIRKNVFNISLNNLEDIEEDEISEFPKFSSLTENKEDFNSNKNDVEMSPTTLRQEKQLLEESHESLKYFTNYENHFLDQMDGVAEFRELNNRLRRENITLYEDLLEEREIKVNLMEQNKEILQSLILLKNVLTGSISVPLDTFCQEQLNLQIADCQLDDINIIKNCQECTAQLHNNNSLKKEIEMLKIDYEKMRAVSKKNEELKTNLDKNLVELRLENLNLKTKIELHEEKLKNMNDRQILVEAEKMKLQELCNTLDSQLKGYEKQNGINATGHCNDCELKIHELNQTLLKHQTENKKLKLELGNKTNKLTTNVDKHLEELQLENLNMKNTIDNLRTSHLAIENEKIKLQDSCHTLSIKIAAYEKQQGITAVGHCNDCELKIQELNQKLSNLQMENQNLATKATTAAEYINKNFKLQSELTEIMSQIGFAKMENIDLKKTIEEKSTELISTNKILTKTKEDNDRINKLNQTLGTERNNALKELSESRMIIETQLNKLKENDEEMKTLKDQLSRQQNKNAQLQERIHNADSHLISELTELREKTMSIRQGHENKIAELSNNLTQAEKEIVQLKQALELATSNAKKQQEELMKNSKTNKNNLINSLTQTDDVLNIEKQIIERLHTKIGELTNEIKQIEENHQKILTKKDAEIDSNWTKIEKLEKMINESNNVISSGKCEQSAGKKKDATPNEIRKIKRRSLQDLNRGLIINENNANNNDGHIDNDENLDLSSLDNELASMNVHNLLLNQTISPKEMRKIKLQLIYAQRRGLTNAVDVPFSDTSQKSAFSGSIVDSNEKSNVKNVSLVKLDKPEICSNCANLHLTINKISEEKMKLLKRIEKFKEKINHLNELNEEKQEEIKILHEQHLKQLEDLEKSKQVCSHQINYELKINEFNEEKNNLLKKIEEYKEKNKILDEENEDMLKYIKSLEVESLDLYDRIEKLDKDLKEMDNLRTKLEQSHNKFSNLGKNLDIMCNTCRETFTKMQFNVGQTEQPRSAEAKCCTTKCTELEKDFQNKETQTSDTLMKKYEAIKGIARFRREEGNYLRAQLNLPPDCPVLPTYNGKEKANNK